VELVRVRLRAFDYHGKLDRQHFSFFKTAVLAPYPIYHHLLFCYNRCDRRLQVKVGCSLFSEWQLKRSLGRVSFISEMLVCDLRGHSRFMKDKARFEKELMDLIGGFLPDHTQHLATDAIIGEALSVLAEEGSLSRDKFPSKLISDLRLVKKLEYNLSTESENTLGPPPKENLALTTFLADLIPEKSEISKGHFTLNVEHAGRKIQQFQLSSPQNFVVHAIGGAIAGGASTVEIHVDADDIVLDFDGKPMTRAELLGLEDSLLHDGGSARSRELAVALNAAKSMDPRSLRLESWHDGSGRVLEFSSSCEPADLEKSPFDQSDREGHRFHFRDKPSLRVVRRFLNSLRVEHNELDLIRRRCGLAPVPLLVNQTDLRNFPIRQSAFYLAWNHPDHPIGAPDLSTVDGRSEDSPADFSALFLVGPPPGLQLTVHGVHYEPPSTQKNLGVWCLVVHNKLDRDISFTGIRDDGRWTDVINALKVGVEQVVGLVLARYKASEGEERACLARLLRQAALDGMREVLGHRIFVTLSDGDFDLKQLGQHQKILYTAKSWTHSLRSGHPVFVLTEPEQEFVRHELMETRFECADLELLTSQTYFRMKEEWLRQPPHETVEFETSYGPTRPLRKAQGMLGLTKSLRPCLLHLFSHHRPLPPMVEDDFPNGLCIAVNWDALETNNNWSAVLRDEAYAKLFNQLTQEIDTFYTSLFDKGARYTNHLLTYLLYRKRKGRKWRQFLDKLEFRVLDGSTRKWSDLTQTEGLAGLTARWLRTIHVAPQQIRLMERLLS
jgi:hypothetical protein